MSLPAAAGDPGRLLDQVVVDYIDEVDGLVQSRLSARWSVSFEHRPPVDARMLRTRRGLSGYWWMATTGTHVAFASWVGRDQLILLDFDPQVVGIAYAPLKLGWESDESGGSWVEYVPDYFARMADGAAVLVAGSSPSALARMSADESACRVCLVCEQLGWSHRHAVSVSGAAMANVRWLAGYRHPRCCNPRYVDALLEAFTRPCSLDEGVVAVGDSMAVRPTMFHLLWSRRLLADLAGGLLSGDTLVRAATGGDR